MRGWTCEFRGWCGGGGACVRDFRTVNQQCPGIFLLWWDLTPGLKLIRRPSLPQIRRLDGEIGYAEFYGHGEMEDLRDGERNI